jgi:hypothetical protein
MRVAFCDTTITAPILCSQAETYGKQRNVACEPLIEKANSNGIRGLPHKRPEIVESEHRAGLGVLWIQDAFRAAPMQNHGQYGTKEVHCATTVSNVLMFML